MVAPARSLGFSPVRERAKINKLVFTMFYISRISLCLVAVLLAGCSPPPDSPRVVLDARLQALYERACVHCHAAKGSGAPQQGDTAEWARRAGQGEAALLASVRQGKGAMPPMAWCAECSQEDFQQLIAYLRAPKE